MKPWISVVTLGVADLETSLRFYRDGMGLPTEGIIGTEFDNGAVSFIEMNDGLRLALYPNASLAKDAKIQMAAAHTPAFSLGHNVGSKAEVDAVMREAEQAGARITSTAHDHPFGVCSGYFLDPDNHAWEIAWNPTWEEKTS